jgi:DNA-binding transcriptional MerR regulator
MIDDKFLSTPEVAERLGVSYQTVRNYPARDLPYFQIKRQGKRLYDPRDVADFIERRKVRR